MIRILDLAPGTNGAGKKGWHCYDRSVFKQFPIAWGHTKEAAIEACIAYLRSRGVEIDKIEVEEHESVLRMLEWHRERVNLGIKSQKRRVVI